MYFVLWRWFSFSDWLFLWRLVPWINPYPHRMDKEVVYNTLVSVLGIPIMARFQILKGSTSTWSTRRNQLVYFRTTCFYNPMKYCILLSFHINVKILNVFQTSPFCPYRVPYIAMWSYQTRVFHLLITSLHILPVHYFTLAPFFAFSFFRLSYINKSFVTRMSYLLPCAKFQRVTSSWSGVTSFPVKTLNCHISRTRPTGIPMFAVNWDLVTSILYTKNRTISSTGTLCNWPLFEPFDPAAAARGRR